MTGERGRAYLKAVAFDVDGTLVDGPVVAAGVLEAIDRARSRGLRIVLVTGRILGELRADHPGLMDHADVTVGENGGVLTRGRWTRRLARPVPGEVDATLRDRGVPVRRGEVLLAAAAADEPAVLAAVREAGLECALVRNRGELMVLPPGVTKGTGVRAALATLGLSPHNTIAVGDAENDHSLFEACELGAAVANAVPGLRAHADVVLAGAAGQGAIELLDGPLLAGRTVVHPRRWRVDLGRTADGTVVQLPASQTNVLIAGGSGSGKSYLAGLVVEQLVELGYSVLVVDPEGDHEGLRALPEMWATGSFEHPPGPGDVARLLQSDLSLVVDLSGLDPDQKVSYLEALPTEVQAQRSRTGRPQWVVVDEAHGSLQAGGSGRRSFEPAGKGQLLVTWQPAALSPDTVAGLDTVVAMGEAVPPAGLIELMAAIGDLPREEVAEALRNAPGRAVLVDRSRPRRLVTFEAGRRTTDHRRHEHKYAEGGLAQDRRFVMRGPGGEPTGVEVASLRLLEQELARCPEAVLRHHLPRHDLSRWVEDVLHEPRVAAGLREIEADLVSQPSRSEIERSRQRMLAVLQRERPAVEVRPT